MVGVLVFAGALATIWSIFKHQTAYATLISSMPPEFQCGDISRHAFGVIVLSPSTPSELQWDYVTSQAGLCFAALCFALACYFAGRTDGAVLLSLGSLVGAYSTIRSWTAYRRNRNRTSVMTMRTMDDSKSFDGMLAPPLRQSHSINRFHGARLTYG